MSDLRVRALELAVEAGAGVAAVKTAQEFLAFLENGAAAPAVTAKKPDPTPTAADTNAAAGGTNSGAASGSAAPDTSTSAGAAAANLPPYTNVDDLKKACMAIGQKSQAELAAAFSSVGAGKWSEVPAEKYPDLWNDVQKRLAA